MQTQKPSVRIEGWAVVPGRNQASYGELRPGNLLVGKVFDHPRIDQGAFIYSSQIISIDEANRMVETRNTCYHLGEANREYKAWVREQYSVAAA